MRSYHPRIAHAYHHNCLTPVNREKEGFWKFKTDGESYREKMIELSNEALVNMEESPLFLRFVSLLIDDTNNMMGHGMKSLQEIRTLEIKQQQAEGELK